MAYRTGNFNKNIDPAADAFNSSLSVDKRLFREDIEGSLAHAKMLEKCGVISSADAESVADGLDGIRRDMESGLLRAEGAEDIHMFIEAELIKRAGGAGKRLHTARSRNDQTATDSKLYVRRLCKETAALLLSLIDALIKKAEKNTDAVMPGFTHMQKAQPVTAAHHLMAYAEMFYRDLTRFLDCKKRLNVLPLGSGALAGTTHPIDRRYVAELLGFDEISNNSLDGVSDRDFVSEFIYAAANTMLHMSRFSEEIVLFSSPDFGYVTVDEAYSTGSSIMPQKRNPDIAELIRGKTGRVYGALTTVLTVMKGLPLAYNKDMQEDKEPLFDAYDTLAVCLNLLTGMTASLTYNRAVMLEACGSGYINATAAADYLVSVRGIPFRTAYEITSLLVGYALAKKRPLDKLTLAEFNAYHGKDGGDKEKLPRAEAGKPKSSVLRSPNLSKSNEKLTRAEFDALSERGALFGEDVYAAIDVKNLLSKLSSEGGPAPSAVKKSIINLKKRLNGSKRIIRLL
ncbi:MAG: argininosuccinate lyase [Clostridiales bacterium]|jgi:argininosuccinate lyase|nr:argininosuccinate lyase [Clostridiales bacterium]